MQPILRARTMGRSVRPRMTIITKYCLPEIATLRSPGRVIVHKHVDCPKSFMKIIRKTCHLIVHGRDLFFRPFNIATFG